MDSSQGNGVFDFFPKEIIRYMLPSLDPSTKNALRLTNKYFSDELSRQTVQDFMICKALCASKRDFARIIIQAICEHEGTFTSRDKKLEFITYVSEHKLQNECFYSISGKFERIGWIFPDNTQDAFKIVCINKNKKSEPVNPFIASCIIGNSALVETAFKAIPKDLRNYNFELGLHILIQNNDIKSLYNLLKDRENRQKMSSMSVRLLQCALFNGSDKVMFLINNSYKAFLTQCKMERISIEKNMDYFYKFLDKKSPIKDGSCAQLTKLYHHDLINSNENNLPRYYRCLNIVVGKRKKELSKFNPPVPVIDKEQLGILKKFKCLDEKKTKKSIKNKK